MAFGADGKFVVTNVEIKSGDNSNKPRNDTGGNGSEIILRMVQEIMEIARTVMAVRMEEMTVVLTVGTINELHQFGVASIRNVISYQGDLADLNHRICRLSMSIASYPRSDRPSIMVYIVTSMAVGVVLFLAAVFLWVIGYQLVYAGRIFPGVSVAGVDISGMSPGDAALKLSQTLTSCLMARYCFEMEIKPGWLSPLQLGMVFDPSSDRAGCFINSVEAVDCLLLLMAGCAPGFWRECRTGDHFDQRVAYQYLQVLSRQVDQPMVEASLHLDGTNVVPNPDRPAGCSIWMQI